MRYLELSTLLQHLREMHTKATPKQKELLVDLLVWIAEISTDRPLEPMEIPEKHSLKPVYAPMKAYHDLSVRLDADHSVGKSIVKSTTEAVERAADVTELKPVSEADVDALDYGLHGLEEHFHEEHPPVKASEIDEVRKQEVADMFIEMVQIHGYSIPRKLLHTVDDKINAYVKDVGPLPIRVDLDVDYYMIIDAENEAFRGIFRYVIFDSAGSKVGNDSGSFEFLGLKLQNAIRDKMDI